MSKLRMVRIAVLISLVGGCGEAGAARDELRVSAAASLTDAFTDVAAAFEAAHPSVQVRLNFAGSSALRAQILEGAPVDVFASAARSHMDRLAAVDAIAGEPRTFARNTLLIAVPADNPGEVRGLDDFARPELLLGLCAEAVPCGALAREVLRRAGIDPAIDTAEPDVRALLTKVALGELDAAMVYVTDVMAAGEEVQGMDIPERFDVPTEYPIAVLVEAPNAEAARSFVEFVLSDAAWTILSRHGFSPP